MSPGYRAALFDLFGTLVHFDTTALPEVEIDGRRLRSTSDGWADLLADVLPGVSVAEFLRATWQVSVELDEARRASMIEFPSRERFRRALRHVGCAEGVAAEVAPLFARGHLERLASVTRFPPAHAALLERMSGRWAIGVVTNFDDTTTAYEILARHGILPRLGVVVVSEAVGFRKPHPTLVRLALRALEVAPREAVMIGDHALEDVGAAVAVGVDAVWIDGAGVGLTAGNPAPRHVVETLPQVATVLGCE